MLIHIIRGVAAVLRCPIPPRPGRLEALPYFSACIIAAIRRFSSAATVVIALVALINRSAASVIGFAEEVTVTSEAAPFICVPITRAGSLEASHVSVDCVVVGGTATEIEDFYLQNVSVVFPPYDPTNGQVCLSIARDCALEGAASEEGFETIELQLRNPSAPATLGRDKTIVKIFDWPGNWISFDAESAVAREDASAVSVTVCLSQRNRLAWARSAQRKNASAHSFFDAR